MVTIMLKNAQRYRGGDNGMNAKKVLLIIEVFYNRQRRHAKLGNISPAEYVRKPYKLNQAA